MLIMPAMGVNDTVLWRQLGVGETEPETLEKSSPQQLFTPAHHMITCIIIRRCSDLREIFILNTNSLVIFW